MELGGFGAQGVYSNSTDSNRDWSMRARPCDRRQVLRATLLTAAAVSSGCARTPGESPFRSAYAGSVPQPAAPPWPISVPMQAPARRGTLDINGAQLRFWDTGGSGPAVVLMHAATGSAENWVYQQPAFARAGFRTIAYSRRGHGESSQGAAGATVTAAEDLVGVTNALGLSSFHLVGTAAGSIYALDYALLHRDRLQSLTLACSLLAVPDPKIDPILAALRPTGFDKLPAYFIELGPSYRAGDPDGVARWQSLYEAAVRGPERRQPLSGKASWAKIADFNIPTFLMTGDADLYAPPALFRKLAIRFPDQQSLVVPEAGHSAYWERPDIFNPAVISFINQHTRRKNLNQSNG